MDGSASNKNANPRKRSFWSEEEDHRLFQVVNGSRSPGGKTIDWKAVTESMSHRSAEMCRKRWNLRQEQQGEEIKKGGWSPDEDQRLIDFMNSPNKPEKNVWAAAAKAIKTRKPDQCSKRWKDALDPTLDHSAWTAEDDSKLIEAQRIYGTTWSEIKNNVFPRRPTLELKNRWDHLSRVLRRENKRHDKSRATSSSPASEGGHVSPATRSASFSSASSSSSLPLSHVSASPVLAAVMPAASANGDSPHDLLASTSKTLSSMSREDRMALCSFLQSSISTGQTTQATQTAMPVYPPSAPMGIPGMTTSSPNTTTMPAVTSSEAWSLLQQPADFNLNAMPSANNTFFPSVHEQNVPDFTTFSPMMSMGDRHASPLSTLPAMNAFLGDASFWQGFNDDAQPGELARHGSTTLTQSLPDSHSLSHASSVSNFGSRHSLLDPSGGLDTAMLDFVFPLASENANMPLGVLNGHFMPENANPQEGTVSQPQSESLAPAVGISAEANATSTSSATAQQRSSAPNNVREHASTDSVGLSPKDTTAVTVGQVSMPAPATRSSPGSDNSTLASASASRRASTDASMDSVSGSTAPSSVSSCPTTPAPDTNSDDEGAEQVIHTEQGKDERVIVIICNRNSLQNVLKDLRGGITEA